MIKIARSFLINTIYTIKRIMEFIFKRHDFKIVSRYIEYTIDHAKPFITDTPLWEDCAYTHDVDTIYYTMNTDLYSDVTPVPEAIDKMILRVKYWYNNKIYKYLTNNPDYTWPPKKSSIMSFHIPLSSAQLLDASDKPVKDILEKIRRYSGPHSDFYGERVKISDMLYFTELCLSTTYPKIKIKNCFGMMKTVDTTTGYLTDLRLP
tara:strand:+ start:1375 stop:1992 length:618 start_codon:yes stop_codon:yes gene_type:complete